jgi:hypothetical protein
MTVWGASWADGQGRIAWVELCGDSVLRTDDVVSCARQSRYRPCEPGSAPDGRGAVLVLTDQLGRRHLAGRRKLSRRCGRHGRGTRRRRRRWRRSWRRARCRRGRRGRRRRGCRGWGRECTTRGRARGPARARLCGAGCRRVGGRRPCGRGRRDNRERGRWRRAGARRRGHECGRRADRALDRAGRLERGSDDEHENDRDQGDGHRRDRRASGNAAVGCRATLSGEAARRCDGNRSAAARARAARSCPAPPASEHATRRARGQPDSCKDRGWPDQVAAPFAERQRRATRRPNRHRRDHREQWGNRRCPRARNAITILVSCTPRRSTALIAPRWTTAKPTATPYAAHRPIR